MKVQNASTITHNQISLKKKVTVLPMMDYPETEEVMAFQGLQQKPRKSKPLRTPMESRNCPKRTRLFQRDKGRVGERYKQYIFKKKKKLILILLYMLNFPEISLEYLLMYVHRMDRLLVYQKTAQICTFFSCSA